jgi:hypothetical protein
MRAGGYSQSFGDIDSIEIPSSEEYGRFDEIDKIQGAIERGSSTLIGQYAADLISKLFAITKQRCPIDVHVNFGACSNPQDNNVFTKKLIWEDVSLPSWSTDDLGTLGSDGNAPVMETSDLSIKEMVEIIQLTFQERAPDVVINQLIDAVICDRRTCGDCDDYSEGCDKGFVLQGGLLGSPGTAPDIIYTGDAGITWASDEILTLLSTQAADGLACLGNYLVVISNAAGSLSYKEQVTILAGTGGGWTEVTTGFVVGGEPNDIWSVGVGAFIVGNSGYTYWLTEPSAGVAVLDAGVATAQNLNAVHALDEENAVAVGQSDTIIYTTNRITWSVASATGGGNHLQGVWMKSQKEWWVVDDGGGLYYTKDTGVTWTAKLPPGAGITALYDIQFQQDSIGYLCGVAGGVGAIWRSYDGGYSWVRLPEGIGTLVGGSTQMNAIAACSEDPNFLIAAGQDGTNDGVLLVGES